MNLGERIKQIRKARGLSAESIAKELGVSVSTVYRYCLLYTSPSPRDS